MMNRSRSSLAYRRALIVLSAVAAGLNALGCKRTEPSPTAAPARSVSQAAAPDPRRPRVFLEDCEFAGWSMIQGGTFLHVAVPGAPPGNSGPPVLTVHVTRDGRVDLASSGHGVRVYGEWPASAWRQTSTDSATGTYAFDRWNGSAWSRDPAMAPSVLSLLPWSDSTILRVERRGLHGTRLSVQNGPRTSAPLRVPPEIDRFDAADVFTLPRAGIALMTGAVDEQTGYTIVAGTTTAVLRNRVGASTATASPSCARILFSQWVDGPAENPGPQVRAVRIREGRVEPGEELPAEPARFVIDRRCHEWLVSSDGVLFEQASPSAGWHKVPLGPEGNRPESTAIAALGDAVWVSTGKTLYVVQAGKGEKVDVPVSLEKNGASFFLAADEQSERLWAAVIPVNEKRGTILTTGPVPQKMRCDELARKIGPN